ncbi:unnamed protein product [Moneuplotes crassus]|uniref:Uncharacterized protein n=1 Tax=Euplotes crassus TaxID=5936 RepID=A0AAD1U469_EUPCR|nr:unnamed protein product [Moneuplotes crassus]
MAFSARKSSKKTPKKVHDKSDSATDTKDMAEADGKFGNDTKSSQSEGYFERKESLPRRVEEVIKDANISKLSDNSGIIRKPNDYKFPIIYYNDGSDDILERPKFLWGLLTKAIIGRDRKDQMFQQIKEKRLEYKRKNELLLKFLTSMGIVNKKSGSKRKRNENAKNDLLSKGKDFGLSLSIFDKTFAWDYIDKDDALIEKKGSITRLKTLQDNDEKTKRKYDFSMKSNGSLRKEKKTMKDIKEESSKVYCNRFGKVSSIRRRGGFRGDSEFDSNKMVHFEENLSVEVHHSERKAKKKTRQIHYGRSPQVKRSMKSLSRERKGDRSVFVRKQYSHKKFEVAKKILIEKSIKRPKSALKTRFEHKSNQKRLKLNSKLSNRLPSKIQKMCSNLSKNLKAKLAMKNSLSNIKILKKRRRDSRMSSGLKADSSLSAERMEETRRVVDENIAKCVQSVMKSNESTAFYLEKYKNINKKMRNKGREAHLIEEYLDRLLFARPPTKSDRPDP